MERLVQLEQEYVVTRRGYCWTIAELLAALRQRSPALLGLLVSLRLPQPGQPGTIARLDEHGGMGVLYEFEARALQAPPAPRAAARGRDPVASTRHQ